MKVYFRVFPKYHFQNVSFDFKLLISIADCQEHLYRVTGIVLFINRSLTLVESRYFTSLNRQICSGLVISDEGDNK